MLNTARFGLVTRHQPSAMLRNLKKHVGNAQLAEAFGETASRRALSECAWDFNKASRAMASVRACTYSVGCLQHPWFFSTQFSGVEAVGA